MPPRKSMPRSSVFIEEEREKNEQLSISVPKDLIDRAKNLNVGLAEINTRLKFDHAHIIRIALRQAVEAGEAELELMRKSSRQLESQSA